MRTSTNFALLCELDEGDVVTMNYRPKSNRLPRVSLTANGRVVAKTDDILCTYGNDILFLGKKYDPDVGREADLFCRDVRYVAAAIQYIRHWRFDKYNSNEKTEPEVIHPFSDDKSAIVYLDKIGHWEIMNGKYSLFPLENWLPI